jgi:hypothetical protein
MTYHSSKWEITEEKRTLLDCFPYTEARPVQVQLLTEMEERWNQADIFVINAPTALGKSAIARSLLTWQSNASYITPTNQLLDQFLTEFPETQTLRRLDSYCCEVIYRPVDGISCARRRGESGGFCKGCPASKALVQAKYKKDPVRIISTHTWHRRSNEMFSSSTRRIRLSLSFSLLLLLRYGNIRRDTQITGISRISGHYMSGYIISQLGNDRPSGGSMWLLSLIVKLLSMLSPRQPGNGSWDISTLLGDSRWNYHYWK